MGVSRFTYKTILFLILSSPLYSQNDSIKQKNYKNHIGISSYGPLFMSSLSINYSRSFVSKDFYRFDLENHLGWTYPGNPVSPEYSYFIGIKTLANHYLGTKKHKLILSSGFYYKYNILYDKNVSTFYWCLAGCVPKQIYGIVMKVGWHIDFNRFSMQISYMPTYQFYQTAGNNSYDLEWRNNPFPANFCLNFYYNF